MNVASKDIVEMLEAESSLGLSFPTNIVYAKELDSPDNLVTVLDMPGRPPQLTLKKGENYYYDAVQIRVRNKVYDTGFALATSIMTALHGRAGETWNATYYSVIICTMTPALLEWDRNNRVCFIINFEVQRR